MYKFILLGSGASPGVPSISNGWGNCNPDNPKNCRTRTSAYIEYNGTKILIDTSPDLRIQLLRSQIRDIDAVLYTHPHADHLHGIDDLREINRLQGKSLNFYGVSHTVDIIKARFPYLINSGNSVTQPNLIPNEAEFYVPFYVNDLKITPIHLMGHNELSTGYIFNDGEVVYIADYHFLDDKIFENIRCKVKLLVMPLTVPEGGRYHAGLSEVLEDMRRFNPQHAVINHMATESDYDAVMQATPENVEPGYDNMLIEFE